MKSHHETVVNAGFARSVRGVGWRWKTEWQNVQGIRVPLSLAHLGSKEFRDHVRAAAPPGEGWILQGYCAPRSDS